MLVPYNVDRRTKIVPFITYALLALNIFFFLVSVGVSNFMRAEDERAAKSAVYTLLASSPEGRELNQIEQSGAIFGEEFSREEMVLARQAVALKVASKNLGTPEGYRQFWQIRHMGKSLVMDPHHSVINTLAYRPGNDGALHRFLSMWSAMFLHGDIEHLFGNMLFLWVFGRAAEEFLGRKFYAGIYFAAGVGATLVQHLFTQFFSPAGMNVPLVGASGAIAGVLGLFAVRYYRTNVRIFYLMGYAWILFWLAAIVAFGVWYSLLGDASAAAILAILAGGAFMFVAGRKWAWGAFWANSALVIGVWVVVLNLVPAIWKSLSGTDGGGGVAYWAHIGGFVFGAAYALMAGGVEEGKDEYRLQDAQKALDDSGSETALNHAMILLQKDGSNIEAHRVVAQAYDRRKATEMAVRHYGKALELAARRGDSENLLKTYNIAAVNHPEATWSAPILWAVARELGKNRMHNELANVLTQIVEAHPNAPEAEIALLKSAQLWGREFGQTDEQKRQYSLFLERYPESIHAANVKNELARL